MFDLEQFSSWLVVALFVVVIAVVLTRQPQTDSDRWERLAAWADRHSRPEVDFDDDPIATGELRETLRIEKLYADLDRLRHLVATDTYMSATRQLGNRLALEQLRQELARQPDEPVLLTVGNARNETRDAREAMMGRHQSGPESLDISWR